MHEIDNIGPLLGVAAFVGLVILVFLLFQQARDIRRLREWAGRAPERAREAADASLAAAEARGEAAAEEEERAPGLRARGSALAGRVAAGTRSGLSEVNRRLPVGPRYLVAGALAIVVAAGVLTGGFGLVGGSSSDKPHHGGRHGATGGVEVAVLNGTTTPNLAAEVQKKVVEAAGYHTGVVTNSPSGVAQTIVMYAPGHGEDAKALATAVESKLGSTPTSPMTADIRGRVQGAPLALVLGLDDAHFSGGGG